jgi:hypothetical protein
MKEFTLSILMKFSYTLYAKINCFFMCITNDRLAITNMKDFFIKF